MYLMYGIYVTQLQNRFILTLPNSVKLAEFIMPTDGREDLNYDVVYNICVLLAERVGFLDIKLSKLKNFKLLKETRVLSEPNCYKIYINQSMLVGVVYFSSDTISAKTVVGISNVICKRWIDYKKNMNTNYNILHSQYFK